MPSASMSMSVLPAMSALPAVLSAPLVKGREAKLQAIQPWNRRHSWHSTMQEVMVMMLHHRQVATAVVGSTSVVVVARVEGVGWVVGVRRRRWGRVRRGRHGRLRWLVGRVVGWWERVAGRGAGGGGYGMFLHGESR